MGSTVTSARVAGTLLVERGLVTSAQLAEALEYQRTHGGALDEVVAKLFRLPLADLRVAMSSDVSSIDVAAILFATGIVDAEKLAEARERSRVTGQPVGPVLVEMGAVTRLELASALADQWSDSPAMILPSPNGRGDGHSTDRGDVNDLKFAMRALEASVRAARITDGSEASLEEVVRREGELADRVAALEAAMALPVEVDAAFLAEFQATVRRTHEIEAALSGLAPAEALASFAAAVDEARELRVSFAELATRMDETVSRESLEDVMGELAVLSSRVEGVTAGESPPSAEEIAVLRETIDQLASRPPGDPETAETLAQRIEELAAALPTLDVADELGALRAQLEELAARPLADEELPARVEELGRSVEALTLLAEASSGAEGLHDALAGLSARLDEGAAGGAELAAAVQAVEERLEAAAGRLDEGAESTASLAQLVAEVRELLDGLAPRIDQLTEAGESATQELAELRGALTGLGERPAGDPELAGRVDALAERVEGLAIDALGPAAAAAVADVATRLDEVAAAQVEEAERLEALRARIEEVRGEVAGLAGGAAQPSLDQALTARMDEATFAIADLAARIEATASAEHVAELRGRVAELDATSLDEALMERLSLVETRVSEVDTGGVDTDLVELRGRLDELTTVEDRISSVLDRLEALESVAGSVTPETPALDELESEVTAVRSSIESTRETLSEEIERLARTWAAERVALEDRVALVESSAVAALDGDAAPSTAAAPELTKLAREMERLQDKVVEQERSLVEHFARREKALAEKVTGGADIVQRLAEITRMIDEQRSRIDRVSGGGGSGGGASGDELETLKESLFNRLERLASSIDWRFQRLEGGAGGPAASAARSDLNSRVEELTRVVGQLASVEGVEMPDHAVEAGDDIYLALVPTATGHQLVELHGELPKAGDTVVSPLRKGELVVVAVGTSPLPGDERACVFVEPAEAAAKT